MSFRFLRFILAVSCLIPLTPVALYADGQLWLPSVFGDHMVLQRQRPVPVWGRATPGTEVAVELENGPAAAGRADDAGRWMLSLPELEAGGPYVMRVTSGDHVRTYHDVMVGEVWLCSGQSNMEWEVARCLNPEQERRAADWPMIRHLKVPHRADNDPQKDQEGRWTVCSPDTVSRYTATGYYFARRLHKTLGVPVGLLNASWGGTRIEPWIPAEGFGTQPELKDIHGRVQLRDPTSDRYRQELERFLQATDAWAAAARAQLTASSTSRVNASPAFPQGLLPFKSHQDPTMLYNGMLHALQPYGIRGAIWYQGESNHTGHNYLALTRGKLAAWRSLWQEDLPYYYVQIAPYHYGKEDPKVLAHFWEQQAAIEQTIPHTGMVVIHDIGNVKDIHPKNKQDVGLRLANRALAQTYGHEGIVYAGPRFESLDIEEGRLRITFDHVGSGLASRDGKPLTHFEIIGEGTGWTEAQAVIEGNAVLLSSPDVPAPQAMRFAWHKLAEPNLMNREGLPGAPFRAGEVPSTDILAISVKESRDYQLVYDLDLNTLPGGGGAVTYTQDPREQASNAFDRVAYMLELQRDGEDVQWAYVSMDAFTDDVAKIGVPAHASGASFQMPVSNMNVYSSFEKIAGGEGLTGGHIEFWPNNYAPQNAAAVPEADSGTFDFGDAVDGNTPNGYGSMQIHNAAAKQTIIAINHWRAGRDLDVGIGNNPAGNPDWTFSRNGQSYAVKRLRVLVRPASK